MKKKSIRDELDDSRKSINETMDAPERPFTFRNFWGDRNLRCFEDFRRDSDMRCIYCGGVADTREHIPSKLFLRRPFPDNLLELPACKECNNSFSEDELYCEVFIDTLKTLSGFSEELAEANISRKRRTTAYNDAERAYNEYLKTNVFTANERVNRIILKLAFGHAVLELNEGAAAWKNYMTVIKHEINYRFEMSNKDYTSFYYPIFMKGKIFPEIGSRAFQNLYVIEPLFVDSVDSSQSNISIDQVVMDWMCIQEGNYEYLTWIESDGIHVKIAIHDFIFAHIILDFYV